MFCSASEAMIALIRYEVCDKVLPEEIKECLTPDFIYEIYKRAKLQDLAHIIASALFSLNVTLDGELKQKLARSQMTAVYRHAQLRHELGRISDAFESAKIPYIPLKGSVIRAYYDKPEMRTSCDIDIFVGEDNIAIAQKLLAEKLSYEFDVRTSHDVAFYSKNKTHVELHFDLIEKDGRVKEVLGHVWEHSHLDGGEYRYLMNNELFFAYHVAHMAKHFLGGGCGVRPFLDLWVMENKMEYDREAAKNLLADMGIEKFANEAKNLSSVWFSGADHTDTTREMEDYILGAGIYGSAENRTAVMQTKEVGKFKYVLTRLFLPYSKLKKIYPPLEKYPILLPFYEVKRWFRYLLRHGMASGRSQLKIYDSVSKEKKERVASLCQNLELDYNDYKKIKIIPKNY